MNCVSTSATCSVVECIMLCALMCVQHFVVFIAQRGDAAVKCVQDALWFDFDLIL